MPKEAASPEEILRVEDTEVQRVGIDREGFAPRKAGTAPPCRAGSPISFNSGAMGAMPRFFDAHLVGRRRRRRSATLRRIRRRAAGARIVDHPWRVAGPRVAVTSVPALHLGPCLREMEIESSHSWLA